MLVSLNIYRLFLVANALFACVCLYVVSRRREMAAGAERLPRAQVGRSVFVRKVLPILGLVAAVGIYWKLLTWKCDVVIVHPGPTATRNVYLGSPDHYGDPPRSPLDGYGPVEPTWIVNESGAPINVVTVTLDRRDPVALPPGEIGVAPSVELIGPDRDPSRCAKTVMERCTWVTW